MRCLAFVLFLSAIYLRGDVTYTETYGSSKAGWDWVPYTMRGSGPDDFDNSTYTPGPFDPAGTVEYTIYIKGSKLARIGPMRSTIYDLDAGTVTQIDPLERTYFVLTFAEMQRHLSGKSSNIRTALAETDDPVRAAGQEGKATSVALFAQSDPQHVLAHAIIWTVPKLPPDVAHYRRMCLDRYGQAAPDLCSLAEPTGLGILAKPVSDLKGFPVMEILERRIRVPSGTRFDDIPKPTTVGGYAADIMRVESLLENFEEGPVDDSHFSVPPGYKLKKSALKSLKR